MDWTGQKLAESLCIYLTLGFGLVAFVAGYARQDFGLMMKVGEREEFDRRSMEHTKREHFFSFQGRARFCLLGIAHATGVCDRIDVL